MGLRCPGRLFHDFNSCGAGLRKRFWLWFSPMKNTRSYPQVIHSGENTTELSTVAEKQRGENTTLVDLNKNYSQLPMQIRIILNSVLVWILVMVSLTTLVLVSDLRNIHIHICL